MNLVRCHIRNVSVGDYVKDGADVYATAYRYSPAGARTKRVLGMSNAEMHEVFAEWNRAELDSYLIEITRDILGFVDKNGEATIDKIVDAAGQYRLSSGVLQKERSKIVYDALTT